MKRILSVLLAMVMIMSVMTFPVNVSAENTSETPYVYYPEGVSQQKIYLTSNEAGTAYVIDSSKHPNGVKVYVGDEIVLTEALDKDDEASDYNDEQLLGTYSMSLYYATYYDETGAYANGTQYNRSLNRKTTPGLKLHPPKESAGGAMLLYKNNTLIVNLPVEASRGVYKNDELNYIPFTTENTKSVGRKQSGKPFTLHLHNTGVEFKFTGTTIGFTIEGASQGIAYCIDGVDGYVYTFPGEFTYILAENLDPNKEHVVKLIRSEEVYTPSPTLISAVTDATAIYATASSDYKIQFIGDSISSGASMPDYTESYVYMTGKKLGWDTEVFSISGMTIYDYMYNNGTRIGQSISYIYDSVFPQINRRGYYTVNEEKPHLSTFTKDDTQSQKVYKGGGTYDFSFQPDVVVINLGSNDRSFLTRVDCTQKLDYNKENFVVYYVDFMKWLTELYGEDVQFICSYGLCDGIGKEINPEMMALIQKAADTFNEETGTTNAHAFTYRQQVDDGIYFTEGDPRNDGHPGVQSHINAADDLVEFIQTELQMGDSIVAQPGEDGTLELPTPVRDGKLFVGWFDENGNAVTEKTVFEQGEVVKLQSQWLEVEEMLSGSVDTDGNVNDYNPVPNSAKYTNGLYIQGAQVRTPLDEKGANSLGLRFISVVNDDLITLLKTTKGIKDVKFGTIVAPATKVAGKTLVKDLAGSTDVVALKIWQNTETLNANYEKFTACVTKIPNAYLATEIYIRPYICYTNASGDVTYIYGEQYETASIFRVAKLAYESGNESAEVNEYLYENIISKTFGDNDLGLDF